MAKVVVMGNENVINGGSLSGLIEAFGLDATNIKVVVDGLEIPADSQLEFHCGIKEVVIEEIAPTVPKIKPTVRIIIQKSRAFALCEGEAYRHESLPTKKELRYIQRIIDVGLDGSVTVVWDKG